MSDKLVVLPKEKEILERLASVYDDKLAQKLYVEIAGHGGEEKVDWDVVRMFVDGIHDVYKDYPPIIRNMMLSFVPIWIDALIKDKVVTRVAKDFLKKAEREDRKRHQYLL